MANWNIPECGKIVTIVVKKVLSENTTDGTKTIVDTKGKNISCGHLIIHLKYGKILDQEQILG